MRTNKQAARCFHWKQCSCGPKPLRQSTPPPQTPTQRPLCSLAGGSNLRGSNSIKYSADIDFSGSLDSAATLRHHPAFLRRPPETQSQKEVACRSTQTAHTGGNCTPAGLQLTEAAVQRSAAHCLPSISPSASLSPLAHPPPPLRLHLSLSPSSGSCHLFQLNPDK